MKTRHEEELTRVSTAEAMRNKYTAEIVVRSWEENLKDLDTGKITTFNRSELILHKGTLLSPDNIAILMFHIQAGDIDDVLISNIRRTGIMQGRGGVVWIATVYAEDRKKKIYLYSNNFEKAYNIVKDYAEQSFVGDFKIVELKEFKYCELVETSDNPVDEDLKKEKHLLIEVELIDESDGETPYEQIYIVKSDNTDEAKGLIRLHIEQHYPDIKEREIIILTAKVIPCNNIIPLEFCRKHINSQQ